MQKRTQSNLPSTHHKKLCPQKTRSPDESLGAIVPPHPYPSSAIYAFFFTYLSEASFIPASTEHSIVVHLNLVKKLLPGTQSCTLHTIGAVAAVHTGDLAVHTGCSGLAGGRAAGDALIVGEVLLLTVHDLGGREPQAPQLGRTQPLPQVLGGGGKALIILNPCFLRKPQGTQKISRGPGRL